MFMERFVSTVDDQISSEECFVNEAQLLYFSSVMQQTHK